ncbi:MAG TPA: glycosyltransferase family 39 protein [Chloroflexota bacterium]|nr:glycosyltransferase family 39 protein [Chloroflexota bacterium]
MLAFGLRVARLDYQSLWHDEVSGVVHSFQSLPDITFWAAANEPHPPLHYYILHLWMLAAGTSEFAARFPSVSFGLLTVPAMYGLLRLVTGQRRALLGALALAVSAFHVYYSQEARMQVEACFFCVAAAWALLLAIRRRTGWLWVTYAALAAASLYTFYYCALVLLAINLPILLRRRWHSAGWWLANSAAVALLIPWLLLVLRTTQRFSGEPLPAGAAANPVDLFRVVVAYAFGITAPLPTSALPAALLLAILLLCAWRLLSHSVREVRPRLREAFPTESVAPSLLTNQLLLLWAFLPPIGGYFLTLLVVGSADSSPRLALISLPSWIAIVVRAWPARWRFPPAVWAAAALMIGLPTGAALAANYAGIGGRDDYRAIFALLRQQASPDEALIYDVPDQITALDYYFPKSAMATFGLPSSPTEAQTDTELAQLAGQYQGVWALLYGEPRPWVENWLDAHLVPVSNQWFGHYVRLKHYAAAPLPPGLRLNEAVPVDATFGPFQLVQIKPANSGNASSIPLELLWQATQPVSSDYARSLQLFDESGQRVAQADGPPLAGAIPTSKWLPGQGYEEPVILQPTHSLVAGLYTLKATMYDSTGATTPQRTILRLALPANKRVVQLDASSAAGWTVNAVAYGPGQSGELLVEASGSIQSTPPAAYTWFLHLLDTNGAVIAQDDHPPLAATTAWRPGDRFSVVFRLPATNRTGATLELGAYDASGRRTLFTTATGQTADHLTLPAS